MSPTNAPAAGDPRRHIHYAPKITGTKIVIVVWVTLFFGIFTGEGALGLCTAFAIWLTYTFTGPARFSWTSNTD